MTRILIGSDHGGYNLKNLIKAHLEEHGVEVKDYGCGMSEETKKHIYDRFYRADKSRNTEGFGLGLSLVHKIIELHKGTIRVQSELGVGSIFTLSLPSDKSSQ